MLVLPFCWATQLASAQKPVRVKLASGTQLELPQASSEKSLDRISRQAAAGRYYWMAHAADLNAFRQAGVQSGALTIEQKIGEGTYLVSSVSRPQAAQMKTWGIDAADALEPSGKLNIQLKAGIIPSHARRNDGRVEVWIEVFKTVPFAKATALLQENGFEWQPAHMNQSGIFQVTCAVTDIERLASLPFVDFVQPKPAPDQTLNQISRSISRASSLQAPLAQGGRNLQGAGVTVGVGDDTDPTLHPDLFDRVINHSPGIVNNHGAHTSGTVGGAGIILPQYAGYAPKASIVSQWFNGIWNNAAQYATDYNMVATNNSYGSVVGDCGAAGTYDLQSKLLDEQAFSLPQMLHVFASGNDGQITCSPFPNSYATVLMGYQSAKNIITAGRSENAYVIGNSSSSGPVKDGRLKPEIIALGGNVISTRGQFSVGNAYFASTGTSMSAPAIVGGLALLNERYRQLNSNQLPTGALMKALLLNGARDMGTPGPDFRHGYGIMHLENSLRMLEARTYSQRSVGQSGVQDTVISLPVGVAQLKVLLYWHDPAASVLAAKTLVNDLDLQVIGPGGTVLPLVLSSDPAQVTNAAIQDTDRTNNSEQVVINTPTPGNYTIRVRGYDVSVNAPQIYAVAFDYLPLGAKISVPFQGESWASGAAIPVNWDFEGAGNNSFTLEYSLNDGNTWTLISSGINGADRFFSWAPPIDAATTTARIRITRNVTGETFTTGAFTILGRPVQSTAPSTEQCEGYFKINWTAVTGADGYDVLLKQGAEMRVVATVSAATTTYTISGLSKDSTYYAAVRAKLNGKAGWWNNALERRPNTGTCTGTISDGDLALDSITAPVSGRAFTSTALGSNVDLKIRIKNLDDAAASAFNIKYSINGSGFTTVPVSQAVAAGATYTLTISGINLSAIGNYSLVAIVENTGAADGMAKNDTFRTTVRHLPNPVLSLASPLTDGFESLSIQTVSTNTTGIAGADRWDYTKTDAYDRLRTRAQSDIARSGQRAVTLDVSKSTPYATNPNNNLIGTFNLSGYNTSNDIRIDFWYQHHGAGQSAGAQNKVWARGSDADPWVEVYDLGVNQPQMPGVYKQSASIELADSLAAKGQQFGSSTQVRFGQRALYAMGDRLHFGGYSFDDIRLYQAVNDIAILSIDAPAQVGCALSSTTAVSIVVRNTMNSAVTSIPVSYSVNGGATVNEVIPSIAANSTITFTFAGTANMAAAGTYSIVATASKENDNVPENNSVTATIVNQPVVIAFPYLQNFESGAGNWYTQGTNNSWQYGTPASRLIKTAASGTKAWKTSLTGSYNDYETSYLYSPCFNINGLTSPTLSFSMAYDIEDCRSVSAVCDAAWVEYSYDGKTWTKLGVAGSGTNWYDYASGNVWMKTNQQYWHVASIALPKQSGSIRLRFVMNSDDGTVREGVAIDDIHIYDNQQPIYTGPTNSNAVTQNISGSSLVGFVDGGKLIAAVNPNGNNLGSTEVKAFFNVGAIRNNGLQYFSNRNITIKPANAIVGNPVTVRYYFTDAEVNELRAASGCVDCKPPVDYTRLNVTKYADPDRAIEDGSITNNINGTWSSILNAGITFVPYDVGYYADFTVTDFSEFYMTDGNYDIALPAKWVRFDAAKEGNNNARLVWETANENNVLHYQPQVMVPGGKFETIGQVAAQNALSASYSFSDQRPGKSGTLLYRIQQTDKDGQVSYSETRSLRFGNSSMRINTYPNPASNHVMVQMDAEKPLLLHWRITDVAGRAALQGQWQMANPIEKWRINIQSLPVGIYQLAIEWNNEKLVQKLVKVKE